MHFHRSNSDDFTPADSVDYRGNLLDCPAEFAPSNDRCIRGFITTRNWFEAEESCTELTDLVTGENLGAHLASIHSDTENTLLVSYYESLFSNGAMKEVFWAGAQRQGKMVFKSISYSFIT